MPIPPRPRVDRILRRVARYAARCRTPYVTVEAQDRRDPFRVLISCLLSLRTKDGCTAAASQRLFAQAATPAAMLNLSEAEIARTIFPVGFYRTKAKNIRAICQILLERHEGRVPAAMEALLALPGVGRKTANLVLTMGFGLPGICVDTHVHRISNRWGWVRTRTPEQTEMALREGLPRRYWIEFNNWLVTFGQNCCTPQSPRCSVCPIETDCPKIGVDRRR
ncbi:MAG: endonuclease III [Candidatus Sumerlaeia bacterium]|nr:endonuclease III [Candidatus Sumerlaeia bacterium]